MQVIDLSGKWRYETDTEDIGITEEFYIRRLENGNFTLPGDACSNKVGKKFEPCSEMTRETVRALRPAYEYIAPLWLQRDFVLPEDFEGKHISLFLERVNIASDLWIDGEKIDRRIIELSTPHIYNLSGRIKSGEHTLTLRIDNRDLLNIDGMASGYSVDTQSIWNGIIGKIELRCEEIFHISNAQVFPQKKSIRVRLTANSDCASPKDRRDVSFTLKATAPNGKELKAVKYDATLYNKKQICYFDYPIRNPEYWNEFNPALYTLNIEMSYGNVYDKKQISFGMRTIEVKDKEFILNGTPIALRGTLDCGIYPLTGYPPTDLNSWLEVFHTVKEYGLNHVRFHAWCPPEAAFAAADMTGVYVLAEMPLWLNTDVCALAAGDDPIHRTYYQNEAINISEHFGNHPSFIMFSNGNELLGDFEMLENITTQIKALDNRRLYTLTTNFDRPVTPADDYLSAFETSGHRVRIQVFHDVVSEHTRLTYDEAVRDTPVPIVSFEVGQYCVYPDVNSTPDYTGNLLPANFEVIKHAITERGVYHMLGDYIKASGHLAALLYKEDIEASLRTKRMGGFELLGLCDYTGQCAATIGLLDVFRKNKGIITAEQFRSFCSPTVPLMKADRVFKNTDTFKAEFDLYNYGKNKIKHPVYKLSFYDGEYLIHKEETPRSRVSFPLDFIEKPTMIKAVLEVGEHKNSWNIFVYTDNEIADKITIIDNLSDLHALAYKGGKAIFKMSEKNLTHSIQGLFKPVFWSPAYFPSDRACGIIVNNSHSAFEGFPTGKYADFQWKHPIDNSVSADVSALDRDFEYLIEPVPNFFDNTRRSPLFEAKVGKADILFCGFDFSADETTVKALRDSIAAYVRSDAFSPAQILTAEGIKKILK